MTPEEAIKYVDRHWRCGGGQDKKTYEALGIVLRLARRQQPDIAAVLDELEDLMERHGWLHIDQCVAELRSKCCPAPKEEKPVMTDAVANILTGHTLYRFVASWRVVQE
jgi:hypothetical protein